MCQQMQQLAANSNTNTNNSNKMKIASYSIKKVLKTFFKKQKSTSTETFESLENLRNMQAEQQHYFHEMEDNSANEKLSVMSYVAEPQFLPEDIYVPVRFARTEAGTFFWTTNLQPVTGTVMPAVDGDLLQPIYCYSNNQYPIMQFQDRWAQA